MFTCFTVVWLTVAVGAIAFGFTLRHENARWFEINAKAKGWTKEQIGVLVEQVPEVKEHALYLAAGSITATAGFIMIGVWFVARFAS